MSRLAGLWKRWRAPLRRRKLEAEMEEELRAHLQLAADEFERQGLDPEEARRAAVLQLGGVEQTRELLRDGFGLTWWQDRWRELRLTVRSLRRAPVYSAAMIGMLGLSIGAAVSLYSVVSATVMRPLRYQDASRLVCLKQQFSGPAFSRFVSTRLLAPLRQGSLSMDAAGMIGRDANVSRQWGEAERTACITVTHNLFRVLQVRPAIGRLFQPADDETGAPKVAVSSHGYWMSRLGGRSEAVGSALTVDGVQYTLIGVLPREFQLAGSDAVRQEIYLPGLLDETRWSPPLVIASGIGRLKPEASPEQAQSEFSAVSAAHPSRRGETPRVQVISWEADLASEARPPLLLLSLAGAMLVAIACANAANLQLARGRNRAREFAVRRALGCGRGGLIQQVMMESLTLSIAGAAAGAALAVAGRELLVGWLSPRLPGMPAVELHAGVWGFAALLGLLTGLLFGLWPALAIVGSDLQDPLQEASRGTRGRSARRFRNALIMGEVALALAGMVLAGLLLRSLLELQAQPGGFQTERVSVGTVDLDRNRYSSPARQSEFARRVLAEIRAIPGVQAAGVSSHIPLGGLIWSLGDLEMEGRVQPLPMVYVGLASPGYFDAMGIPLLAGRRFNDRDRVGAEEVVLVDRRFAELYCGTGACIGQRIAHWRDEGRFVRIVGMVGGVRLSPASEQEPTIYRPIAQEGMFHLEFVVKHQGAGPEVRAGMTAAAKRVDPEQPMHGIEGLEERRAQRLAPNRAMVSLVGVLGSLALLFGALGVGAALWHEVAMERRAIGIRMALGASTIVILRREMGRGMRLVAAGALLGSVLAMALAEWMKGEIWGIGTKDVASWGLALAAVLGVGMLACLAPAWLGARVQPAEVLRAEN